MVHDRGAGGDQGHAQDPDQHQRAEQHIERFLTFIAVGVGPIGRADHVGADAGGDSAGRGHCAGIEPIEQQRFRARKRVDADAHHYHHQAGALGCRVLGRCGFGDMSRISSPQMLDPSPEAPIVHFSASVFVNLVKRNRMFYGPKVFHN